MTVDPDARVDDRVPPTVVVQGAAATVGVRDEHRREHVIEQEPDADEPPPLPPPPSAAGAGSIGGLDEHVLQVRGFQIVNAHDRLVLVLVVLFRPDADARRGHDHHVTADRSAGNQMISENDGRSLEATPGA